MKRRKTRGKAGRVQRGKALRPRSASKAASNRGQSRRDTIVAQCLRERDEALELLAATSDVLQVINASPGNLALVFDAMLERATRLCEAGFGVLWRFDGERFSAAAEHAIPDALAEFVREPVPVEASASFAEIVKGANVVHVSDLAATELYDIGNRVRRAYVQLGGARTLMSVALRKDNVLLGAFNVYRQEVRPFTDKQIELVQNFAAQAVIAIENTRLLNELRQRTEDLTESLEQQTATSEILGVISNSPTDTQPAFDAIVHSGLNLFPDAVVSISLPDRDLVKLGAIGGADEAGVEALRGRFPMPLSRKFITGTAILDRREIDLADGHEPPKELTAGAQNLLAGGYRAVTVVPMVRGDETIGTLNVVRRNPGPLSEKQRQLLRTFANQAVIAIENTRLFNELRQRTDDLSESLEQQTATSKVLQVISSSPGQLNPVFNTVLENAVRICGAKFGILYLVEGDGCHTVAMHDVPKRFADKRTRTPFFKPPPSGKTPMGRVMATRQVAQIDDITQGCLLEEDQALADLAELGGARTVLAVPMIKDVDLVGGIVIYRQQVRRFTEKQIELVQNFAAQAVIAIENTRLLNELRSRTQELAASLENLRTTQDRLVQTQKLALLGQLTAGIAHEIKNPLNFVNNFSGISAELIGELRETLEDVPLEDKARTEINELTDTLKSNFDKVVHHGRRADAIVKNMLQHSREGSGEHRAVDINALVEESLNLAWHGARAETQGFEIKLKQSLDPSAGEADIFPQDIRRALLNVISNGFHAASKRRAETDGDYEPTLTASTKNLGDHVEIRIRDNGTGITPEVKEKMFNPFFTTKPTGEGTGLGLSISHDIIVKQHGGSIEVETKPGEFAEIRVILPRVAALLPVRS